MLLRHLAALTLLLSFAMATTAEATLINTIIGNFDIAFDGASGELTDFNRPDGGNLDTAEARTFSSFETEVGGTSTIMLMDPPADLFGDLKITGLGSELTTNMLVENAGSGRTLDDFGFDFFTPDGDVLRIGIADISYTLVQTGIPGLNFFNWFADGKVLDQSLPNGVVYAEDVLVSYTATDVMVIEGSTGIRSLVASGAMTITGENFIPEPTAAMLLGVGAAAAMRRR